MCPPKIQGLSNHFGCKTWTLTYKCSLILVSWKMPCWKLQIGPFGPWWHCGPILALFCRQFWVEYAKIAKIIKLFRNLRGSKGSSTKSIETKKITEFCIPIFIILRNISDSVENSIFLGIDVCFLDFPISFHTTYWKPIFFIFALALWKLWRRFAIKSELKRKTAAVYSDFLQEEFLNCRIER